MRKRERLKSDPARRKLVLLLAQRTGLCLPMIYRHFHQGTKPVNKLVLAAWNNVVAKAPAKAAKEVRS